MVKKLSDRTSQQNSLNAANAPQASNQSAAANAINAGNSETNAAASATAAAASAAAAQSAGSGGAVKISATDTTSGFMTQKFVEGIDIVFTHKNVGSNETLEVSSPYGVAYAIALGG